MTTPRRPRSTNDFTEADAGDFAGEHDETDLADDPAGGPEHAEEEETRGHAGMD
ncbi:hypothetical protein GCM10022255_111390 [Dactylosporangium darangshiense]|uniref:Uncharacterized protein n=2 Tax=Dactylosporangium darangshiense TaxID=579108 RepID=A0ABP8DUV4_9ACTN